MGMFTNGNARVTRLTVWQLGFATLSLVLMQIQGFLPSMDFISPKAVKITSFVLAIALTVIKGGEMFFSKTASLFKGQETDSPDAGSAVTTVTQTTEVKTNP